MLPLDHDGAKPTHPRHSHVLLVDDSVHACAEITRMLLRGSERRYELTTAATGEEAIERCRSGQPISTLLLDFSLPDMSAVEVLAALPRDGGDLPFPTIVITGRAGREEGEAVLRAGAHDFIGKGWMSPESLTRAVENAEARFAIQRALRRRDERLRLAFAVARMGWWDWDVEADVFRWSDDLYPMFGLAPTELKGTLEAFFETVHPDDRPQVREAFRAAVESSTPYDIEFRVIRPDGSIRWAAVKAMLFRDADGRRILTGVDMDVTDRRELDARREALLAAEHAARKESERLNRLKDEFLATLSHELRTPLNAIVGWSQILVKGARDNATAQKAAEVIARNAQAQAQMVNDLLDMNRILVGKLRLEPRPTSIAEVARAAVDTIRPAATARGIRLRTALAPDAEVYGDPDRLQQILWNFLTNAVKFTPPGGEVSVSIARPKESIAVSVRDTGEGIAPEFLPYVFDRFRQADASAARRHDGLGLGLSIVRGVAELHGGSVRVESEGRGHGSTFTLLLPAVTELAYTPYVATGDLPLSPPPLSAPSGAIEANLAGARILIVDDEPDSRELLERLLIDRGARVLVAGDASAALDLLEQAPVDVLVSDIGMPQVDGYELIRRLRQRGAGIPALALTAFARDEDRARALEAGYQDHVSKPVNPAVLLAAISKLTCPAPAG